MILQLPANSTELLSEMLKDYGDKATYVVIFLVLNLGLQLYLTFIHPYILSKREKKFENYKYLIAKKHSSIEKIYDMMRKIQDTVYFPSKEIPNMTNSFLSFCNKNKLYVPKTFHKISVKFHDAILEKDYNKANKLLEQYEDLAQNSI